MVVMTPTSAGSRAGRGPGRASAVLRWPGRAARAAGRLAGGLARAPVARRSRDELVYWVAALGLGVAGAAVTLVLVLPGLLLTASLAGALLGLALLAAATGTGRGLGGLHRRLVRRWLGVTVADPGPYRNKSGLLGGIDARLRDAAGWRGVGYVLVRFPLGYAGLYFVVLPWAAGLFYLTYPVWWALFAARTAPAGGRGGIGSPLPAGGLHITTVGAALAVSLLGVALLLVAPWTTRLLVAADLWLIRRLLGGGGPAARIRALEASRASAVDDSAALLRRVERDLHDGTQARLVALAMHLGRAREQLGDDGDPPDAGRVRDLVAAAHQDAKDALVELRDLARGIHPPALDAGLADALASLTASSAVPATLRAEITARPTPAIETIAYFCVAELLTNAARHGGAGHAAVEASDGTGGLVVTVSDDGSGGAAPRPGGGLAGLAQRVATVDGTLAIASPAGGPTVVTITLPVRA
jgi:putative sensor protein/histidine kinase/histidine kinase/DNA gyrase B/HSP90-like ATPase